MREIELVGARQRCLRAGAIARLQLRQQLAVDLLQHLLRQPMLVAQQFALEARRRTGAPVPGAFVVLRMQATDLAAGRRKVQVALDRLRRDEAQLEQVHGRRQDVGRHVLRRGDAPGMVVHRVQPLERRQRQEGSDDQGCGNQPGQQGTKGQHVISAGGEGESRPRPGRAAELVMPRYRPDPRAL